MIIWSFGSLVIFFYMVQGGGLFVTKSAPRVFAEHALWPNMNIFPSIERHSNS